MSKSQSTKGKVSCTDIIAIPVAALEVGADRLTIVIPLDQDTVVDMVIVVGTTVAEQIVGLYTQAVDTNCH